jgi:hypothetical protein
MPSGGKRENSGRKRRDPVSAENRWIIERIRHHLMLGDRPRNERWKKKNLKSKFFVQISDANELYAKIKLCNLKREKLILELDELLVEKQVNKLSEHECPKVKSFKILEIKLNEMRSDLKYIFETEVPGGGLLTPIPPPSHQDMSRAFKSVSEESVGVFMRQVTVREIKEVWSVFLKYDSLLKATD